MVCRGVCCEVKWGRKLRNDVKGCVSRSDVGDMSCKVSDQYVWDVDVLWCCVALCLMGFLLLWQ